MPSPTADSPKDTPWTGRLTLTPGMVIYTGPGGDAGLHSHHAIQLVRSLDTSFELIVEGETTRCEAALIPSGLSQSFRSGGEGLAFALLDAHARVYKAVEDTGIPSTHLRNGI